jgi:hypothetical protein
MRAPRRLIVAGLTGLGVAVALLAAGCGANTASKAGPAHPALPKAAASATAATPTPAPSVSHPRPQAPFITNTGLVAEGWRQTGAQAFGRNILQPVAYGFTGTAMPTTAQLDAAVLTVRHNDVGRAYDQRFSLLEWTNPKVSGVSVYTVNDPDDPDNDNVLLVKIPLDQIWSAYLEPHGSAGWLPDLVTGVRERAPKQLEPFQYADGVTGADAYGFVGPSGL